MEKLAFQVCRLYYIQRDELHVTIRSVLVMLLQIVALNETISAQHVPPPFFLCPYKHDNKVQEISSMGFIFQ